jgi:starch phosphorylase
MNDDKNKTLVAYLSMEIALENDIKTYAGGLGVLAGDILRSAVGLKFPMVGITLLNDKGYFKQKINYVGEQLSSADSGYNFSKLKKLPPQVIVVIGLEKVKVGVWQYLIKGQNGFSQPVYFLDTNIAGNSSANRKLTGELYGGNEEYRLKQEIILGRGGVKMLNALGYKNIKKFHLNEGHGSLAAVELFLNSQQKTDAEKIKEVRRQCVFTTHTPFLKSKDAFSLSYLLQYQPDFPQHLSGITDNNEVELTLLGFYFSGYINGVSKLQQKTLDKAFPGYKIQAVTNGVNSVNWTAPEFQKLYDKYVSGWRIDGQQLAKAISIPSGEIWLAHQKAKRRLLNYLKTHAKADWQENVFTLGFARRFTSYKRPEFLLSDIKRLLALQNNSGKLQIIYAGKAHPDDLEGQSLIKQVWKIKEKLADQIKIVFLEDYDLTKAQLLTAGVDLWLNTPIPPHEASGTSGMKAAHNGVPQLSTLDGWWREGYAKNKTGWAIKEDKPSELYDLLTKEIMPLYYQQPEKWSEIMRTVISRNAAFFNTDRAIRQYIRKAYRMGY